VLISTIQHLVAKICSSQIMVEACAPGILQPRFCAQPGHRRLYCCSSNSGQRVWYFALPVVSLNPPDNPTFYLRQRLTDVFSQTQILLLGHPIQQKRQISRCPGPRKARTHALSTPEESVPAQASLNRRKGINAWKVFLALWPDLSSHFF
jgi:hypothetical protein